MEEGQNHLTSIRGLNVYHSAGPSHEVHWPWHTVRKKKPAVMLRDVQAVSRREEETFFAGG